MPDPPRRPVLAFLRITLGAVLAVVALLLFVLFVCIHLWADGSAATASCLRGNPAWQAVLASTVLGALTATATVTSLGLMLGSLTWQMPPIAALVGAVATLLLLGAASAVGYDDLLQGLRCPARIYV